MACPSERLYFGFNYKLLHVCALKEKKKKVEQGLLCLVQGRISRVIEAIQSSKVYKPSKIRQCNSLHTLWCQLVKRSKWLSVRAFYSRFLFEEGRKNN